MTDWEETTNGVTTWAFNSLPNPEVNDKVGFVLAGQVVGGSSAVNGMFFDRPSRYDFEAWDRVNDDGEGEDRWDWDGIFPHFRKVRRHLTQPDKLPADGEGRVSLSPSPKLSLLTSMATHGICQHMVGLPRSTPDFPRSCGPTTML